MHALKRLSLAALTVAFFASFPALADDPPASEALQKKTAIVVDEDAGVIWFFIKGKEKALLDETGLHVRENISIGGVFTDYGTAYFDALAAKSRANDEAGTKSPRPGDETTAVVVDEKSGAVRILTGGKEIVVIDETGLYVRGDVAYKGTITDGLPLHLNEGGDAQ